MIRYRNLWFYCEFLFIYLQKRQKFHVTQNMMKWLENIIRNDINYKVKYLLMKEKKNGKSFNSFWERFLWRYKFYLLLNWLYWLKFAIFSLLAWQLHKLYESDFFGNQSCSSQPGFCKCKHILHVCSLKLSTIHSFFEWLKCVSSMNLNHIDICSFEQVNDMFNSLNSSQMKRMLLFMILSRSN